MRLIVTSYVTLDGETLERILAEDENYQGLLKLIERAKIDLATGKRPAAGPVARLA